jgi:quercetin dioxygenase-like cupin family protein
LSRSLQSGRPTHALPSHNHRRRICNRAAPIVFPCGPCARNAWLRLRTSAHRQRAFGTLNENTSSNKTGKWGLILKTLDSTDIGADRLTVQAGGYSGWHAHPAPVFVTVTQGSIIWVDGSDPLCTPHTYNAGDSFIEHAYRVHNVRNASDSATAEFVAIVIKPIGYVGPAFRLDRPEPNNCAF